MIELDVRRTADGELLVYHDEAFNHLVLAKNDHREVLGFAATLGVEIPRFAEVLEMTSGRILLDVELKEAGYENSVLSMMFDHHFRVEDFIVTSFNVGALRHVREECSGIQNGLLVENMSSADAIRLFQEVAPDYLAPDHELLDKQMLSDAADLKVRLIPWTVNQDDRLGDLLGAQAVFGLITDRPLEALRIRSSMEK